MTGRVYVVMGVSGSGKTSVGRALAQRLEAPFYDGDDFHPPENVAKMARGVPLDDTDRHPWLLRLQALIAEHLARGATAVVACSALKKRYRDLLCNGNDGVDVIFLQGSMERIWERMAAREEHYMQPEMLASQFDALEPPSPQDALVVSIEPPVETIVDRILERLHGGSPSGAQGRE